MTKFHLTNIAFVTVVVVCAILGYMVVPYWKGILLVGFLIYLLVIIGGVVNVRWQFYMPVICDIPNNKKQVFLTFDDGPQKQTQEIIDFLKKHDCKGNFFCIGKNLKENPELAQGLSDEGHFIGNHSYFHELRFPIKSTNEMIKELKMTNELIEKITGEACGLFRPPFGVINPRVTKAVKSLNMKMVGWNIRSFDTQNLKGKKALQMIVRDLKSGDIILLHDHSGHVISILEGLLPVLKEQNFACGRIDSYLN